MFRGDVLLQEICGLEELIARLAAELALGFLLDVRRGEAGDLPLEREDEIALAPIIERESESR